MAQYLCICSFFNNSLNSKSECFYIADSSYSFFNITTQMSYNAYGGMCFCSHAKTMTTSIICSIFLFSLFFFPGNNTFMISPFSLFKITYYSEFCSIF